MNEVVTILLTIVIIFATPFVVDGLVRLMHMAREHYQASFTREQQQTIEMVVRQTVDAANRERLLAILKGAIFDAETYALGELKYRLERMGIHPDWVAVQTVLRSQIYRSYQAAMNKQSQGGGGGTRGLAIAPTSDQMAEALWAVPAGEKGSLN